MASSSRHLFKRFQYIIHVLWMEYLHVFGESEKHMRGGREGGREEERDGR